MKCPPSGRKRSADELNASMLVSESSRNGLSPLKDGKKKQSMKQWVAYNERQSLETRMDKVDTDDIGMVRLVFSCDVYLSGIKRMLSCRS